MKIRNDFLLNEKTNQFRAPSFLSNTCLLSLHLHKLEFSGAGTSYISKKKNSPLLARESFGTIY